MDELITWLKGCLDDDERTATAVFRDHTWSAYLESGDDGWAIEGTQGELSCIVGDEAMAAHIARWDPARVLREVEAKRLILEEHRNDGGYCDVCADPPQYDATCGPAWPCETIKLVALSFSDREGYREEWAA